MAKRLIEKPKRAKRVTYQQVSAFWAILVPGVLIFCLYWAYHHPGYVGNLTRDALQPILDALGGFAKSLFPGLRL
jgi:hypothetical protein